METGVRVQNRPGAGPRKKDGAAVLTGLLAGLLLIYILLISTMEYICYSDMNYYRAEYEKHEVLKTLPEMSLDGDDGLMALTVHMMKYLRGDADTPELQMTVRMGGELRGFFSQRELDHMADVQKLFIGAIRLRRAAIAGAALLLLCSRFLICRDRRRFLRAAAKGVLMATALFLVLAGALGVYIARDFNAAFIQFHHIFFTNDLWILDPNVDMLVNIVPEGFFFDVATRILRAFLTELCLLVGGCVLILKRTKTP